MAQFRYLSGYNGYMPRETGMVVGFIRKPENFSLNKWVQYIPTKEPLAFYFVLGFDESVRIPQGATAGVSFFSWEDGDPRPRGEANKHQFQMVPFRTDRKDFPWTLGYIAMETAAWKPKLVHMDDAISRAMTGRTLRVCTLAENSANWGVNFAPANTLNNGAGNWSGASDDPSNPKYLAVKKSLLSAARAIHLATNGKVKMHELRVVMSPGTAILLAETPEFVNYCRESPQALQIVKDGLGQNQNLWSLPDRYNGFELVVEDSPIVYDYPNSSGTEATTNRQYIKSDTTAYVVSRPGGLDGEYGTKNYSTIQLYHYGALLEVEVFDEPKDRRVDGHCTENIKEVLPVSQSGFLIQSVQ